MCLYMRIYVCMYIIAGHAMGALILHVAGVYLLHDGQSILVHFGEHISKETAVLFLGQQGAANLVSPSFRLICAQ